MEGSCSPLDRRPWSEATEIRRLRSPDTANKTKTDIFRRTGQTLLLQMIETETKVSGCLDTSHNAVVGRTTLGRSEPRFYLQEDGRDQSNEKGNMDTDGGGGTPGATHSDTAWRRPQDRDDRQSRGNGNARERNTDDAVVVDNDEDNDDDADADDK